VAGSVHTATAFTSRRRERKNGTHFVRPWCLVSGIANRDGDLRDLVRGGRRPIAKDAQRGIDQAGVQIVVLVAGAAVRPPQLPGFFISF